MFHKLKDGDLVKILPFIDDNGRFEFGVDFNTMFLKKQSMTILDNTKILNKLFFKYRNEFNIRIAHRTLLNVCIDGGDIKTIAITRTLNKIIEDNEKLLDMKDNYFLMVRINDVSSPIGPLPSYDNSHVVQLDWEPLDISLIKKQQANYSDMFEKNSPMKNRDRISKEFGKDLISEIITEEREEKINKILN